MGRSTVERLVAEGAKVCFTYRNRELAETVLRDLGGTSDHLTALEMDASSLASVRSCAKAYLTTGRPLDALVPWNFTRQETADGFERVL